MKPYCLFLALFFIGGTALAQPSLNVELLGQYNPEDGRASGSWGYAAPDGTEYAILGGQTGTYIIEIGPENELTQRGFIPGPPSNWREVTVVKGHAYVVTEGSALEHPGMQIIDLNPLPANPPVLSGVFNSYFVRAHIIQKDLFSEARDWVYVCGTTLTQGVHIIDVSNPGSPEQIGLYEPGYYIHDCHVRDTLLFAAAFYEGTIDVVSIADPANPELLYRLDDPSGNTHSVATTADMQYLFLANEQDGLIARIFDISDLNNPEPVATYTANLASLVHNPYIRGDFAYITHNTEGLRVVDLADPEVPVETGFYDTFDGPSGGFNGLWSACPYLPSGKIIGGNREDGLYLWSYNGARAGRYYGVVKDSLTGEPIANAVITLAGVPGQALLTGFNGEFSGGELPGEITLSINKSGYLGKEAQISLQEGSSQEFEVLLTPVPSTVFEQDGPSELRIYPNPAADGQLYIDCPPGVFDRLALYAADGQLLRSWAEAEIQQGALRLNGLPPGIYWASAWGRKGGQAVVKSIVVPAP